MNFSDLLSYLRTNPVLFPNTMTDAQAEDVMAVIGHCQSRGVTSTRQIAYVLGTALADNDMEIGVEAIDAMIDGTTTGHALSEYFTDDVTDWESARKIVNEDGSGAEDVSLKARAFHAMLKRIERLWDNLAATDTDPQSIGLA